MEAKTFKVEFTPEQREELGREAHAAALRHCPWENLFPAVRHAYREQGVRVARLALLMAEREPEVLRIGKRIAPADGSGFAVSLKFAASLTKVPAPAPRAAAVADKPAPPPSPPVKAKPLPPLPPVESRVVEVEFITGRDSRFKCAPLRCVLTAGSCVDRQAKATGARSGADSKALASRKEANVFAACKACPLGKRVAQQLAAHVKLVEAQ